ncbi:hypothetical protein C8A03DRAFT_41112 [Achaetomium macrosporum]|uniref:Zn(2)-C6 fungal-type domain-containing protein n=1 Tax=Achaetomium macrosporum TaxID=79813 RepID=A0AAN7CG77_9PEZI|nr:hypothetical protein C8A03DRAFT_41112 [Achaetomium macrosporum]
MITEIADLPDEADSPDSGPPASTTETPPASGTELTVRVRRRPIPRKGHTKSRRGCFNCKRRKVKCQETRPECSNCTRIGLVCEYPDGRSRSAVDLSASDESALSVITSPSAPLQSTPSFFTYTDMRFFHHFLVAGYPPLPIFGDQIWSNVATMSHTYDYLMHAMLGMAASHITIHGGGDFSSQALFHRVKAIHCLNQALSSPVRSAAEGDARFGAMMALAFQASCMPDGMNEFISMIKGCHIIANTSLLSFSDSLFQDFTQVGYSESVRRALGPGGFALRPDQELLIDDFLKSLRALAPLCTSPLEIRLMASTERIAKLARWSAAEAFAQFAAQYTLIFHASNEDFHSLIDTDNHGSQLLLLHFILIEFAIGHMALGELGRRFAYRVKTCLEWMKRVVDALPPEYQKYAEWPVVFAREYLGG